MAANMSVQIFINLLFAGSHRVRRGLQRRARVAVGAQPRAGEPAGARLHPSRDLADPARRAGAAHACRAPGRCVVRYGLASLIVPSIESEVYRFPLFVSHRVCGALLARHRRRRGDFGAARAPAARSARSRGRAEDSRMSRFSRPQERPPARRPRHRRRHRCARDVARIDVRRCGPGQQRTATGHDRRRRRDESARAVYRFSAGGGPDDPDRARAGRHRPSRIDGPRANHARRVTSHRSADARRARGRRCRRTGDGRPGAGRTRAHRGGSCARTRPRSSGSTRWPKPARSPATISRPRRRWSGRSEEAVRAAEFAVNRAEYELQLARARLQSPQTAGGSIQIVSPIDGVLLKRFKESVSVVAGG